ncbi:E3 ubiquitin-protein ligase TRIM71-like isoform X1 [Halichondria panicea]|uniref:E3 ubiquitin-protein ligase TRIM71-like isoform X1 n=2 Tax=Halichondria panicea TaxID=6063 RepID=UPI00312B7AEE
MQLNYCVCVPTQDSLPRLNKVEKMSHIECSVCNKTFQEPKLLPCFHTFCKVPCLERLVVQDCRGQSLACPVCQHLVPLPNSGVAGLQPNLYAESLLKDQLHLLVSKKSKKRDCENCQKVAATKYCQQCKKFMCDKCIQMHQMWGDFSDHKLADADDTKIDQQVNNCKEHREIEAEYFCETCSDLVCTKCTNDMHKGHKHNLISSVYPKHKLELISSLKPLQEGLHIVQEALVASDDMVKAINDQKTTIETDINKEIDHLKHVLHQRGVELLASVKSYAEQKLQKIAIHKDTIKMTQEKMSRCLEYTEAALKVGTEGEVLRMKASTLKGIEEITAEFEPNATKLSAEADLQWYPNNQVTQACREFGTVFCNSIDGEEIYDDLDFEISSNSAYQAMSRGSIKKPSLPTPASEKQIVNEMPHYSAVIPSLETFRKPVKVISDLSGPFGVTSNSRRQLIVTDSSKNQVLIMTADGQKIASFGKQGSKKCQFKHPCGLTVDQDDNIYVVDTNNHRIQKFSPEGKFLGAVGSPGNNKLQFSYPIGICFNDTTRHLYVCDQANNRIQVLSTNMTFVSSFGSQGNGDGELIYPKNAAFDSSNFLYVTDCGNNRVQVFTADGQYIQSFNGKASGKELEKPFAITVDSSNTIYVSELKRHCITKYTAQGKYVSSFGRNGTEEGLFKDIGCLYAYHSAIIASDTSNNRLQIF